jgi:glycosyltransferase involved in cell wall biosynthesis
VFNRSVRGECNMRVFEALASGALLFQEEENAEVPSLLRYGEECVFYNERNLEELLMHYLANDGARESICRRAYDRVADLTFHRLWSQQVVQIEDMLPLLRDRVASRVRSGRKIELMDRTWQWQSAAYRADAALPSDLEQARDRQPSSASVLHLLGIHASADKQRKDQAAGYFQEAFNCDPRHVTAGASLAETLLELRQAEHAADQAKRVLALVNSSVDLGTDFADAPLPHQEFSSLRMAWEKAAYAQAGNKSGEIAAKRNLIAWWMHSLLGDVIGEVAHYYEALRLEPQMAVTQAALGDALLHKGLATSAVMHLEAALAANPFDAHIAGRLNQALVEAGHSVRQQELATERGRLQKAAPTLVPGEEWFVRPVQRPTPPMTVKPLRIVWQGDQSALHSLAIVNREICARLIADGHEVSLSEREQGVTPSRQAPLSDRLKARLGAELSGPADIHIFHQWPPALQAPREGYWIWMQPWEYGSIPASWLSALVDQVDELWVPSAYVRRSFLDAGVPDKRVVVVPNGVSRVFFESHSAFPLRTKKRFKFLFVGGTIHRKGFDVLLAAYGRTFRASDDVCLVVKDMGVGTFYQGQTAEQLIAEFRASPNAPEIEYLTDDLTPEEMAGLYQACNCLVHPYRAEGFGMPIAEALASGLPVIVTGHGAALDFCREEHAYLVPARIVHSQVNRIGDLATVGTPSWGEADLDFLRYYLRHVFENEPQAREKGKRGQEFIRRNFTWERTLEVVEARLAAIQAQPIHRPLLYRDSTDRSEAKPTARRTVSLTMIVKNEEENLEACLDSVAHLVDEMIVVDTGSTDRTVEIAQSKGAKVFHFPWVDNFAAARNEALWHAQGEWIFWMDADDRLDSENQAKLRQVFGSLDDGIFAYQMKCLCVADADEQAETVVDHIRLFPNRQSIRWKYRVHEQILGAVRSAGGDVRWTDVIIRHVGYVDPATRQRKLQRDLRLLELENQESPDDPFTLFNLGSSYHELQEPAKALIYLQHSLQLSHPGASIVRKLYSLIARCQRLLGQLPEAMQTCQSGRQYYPEDPELLFQESMIAHDLKDLGHAIECLRLLIGSSGETRHFASVDTGLRGYKSRHMLAAFLREQGNVQAAEHEWRLVLRECPSFQPAWLELGELLIAQKRWSDVLEVANQLEELPGAASSACALCARSLLAQGAFTDAREQIDRAVLLAPDALYPRVIRSHILLQEGQDLLAAEAALLEVLQLAPNHQEARHNLELLRKVGFTRQGA